MNPAIRPGGRLHQLFERAVAQGALLGPGDHVLAAVSGGLDSVALLLLLADHARRHPMTITVAHVNHGIRGEAADSDQRFVEELAVRCGLACESLTALESNLPPSLIDRMRRGSEEAARRIRHAVLTRAARRVGAARIALGHTMDDQAETVLMRLLRGAGRRGLSGMAASGPGRLIRPMLDIRREEAATWLAAIGQDFRRDETNTDPRFLRNRIRLELLPLLGRINPAIIRVLARTGGVLAEEDRFLDALAADWLAVRSRPNETGGVRLDAGELAQAPRALGRRVARLLIEAAGGDPRGAGAGSVAALLELAAGSAAGAETGLAGGMRAARDGQDLVVRRGPPSSRPATPEGYRYILSVPGRVDLPGGAILEATVSPRERTGEPASVAPGAMLDADRLGDPVLVRTRLPGDRFHPLGGPGSRKLKDFLIDAAVPQSRRDSLPLVVGPAGIAWVAGVRPGEPYRVGPATRRVVILTYTGQVDLGLL